MIYACKIIIKEDKWNDNFFFNIYIKYKPFNSFGLYKKYYILNELRPNYAEDTITLTKKLKWFNKLSMEDIKQMVVNHIKEKQTENSADDKYEKELQQLIKSVKEKANKFTIEV